MGEKRNDRPFKHNNQKILLGQSVNKIGVDKANLVELVCRKYKLK